jgi:cytoskeletal protein CcmA (bactofilin family)
MNDTQTDFNEGDSLEAASSDSGVKTETQTTNANTKNAGGVVEQPIDASGGRTPSSEKHRRTPLRRLLARYNLYLLLFVFLLIVGSTVFVVALLANKASDKTTVTTQSLSEDTLKELANNDVTVGQPKQVLNVQSNAVFAGKVLIQDSLQVAGAIQVGGSLSIPGITVSGNSVFDQVQVNKSLIVAGDSAFQGQISTQKSLSVAGGGTFGGALSAPQITANTLQLNGNLTITRHIAVGGAAPGRTNGPALGSAGTSSVNGSDTAGNININTGTGAAAGCFVTVNFAQKFNSTPYVLLTPIGAAAANVGYYVTRTTSNFTVCAANTPPSQTTFGFDYFVLE